MLAVASKLRDFFWFCGLRVVWRRIVGLQCGVQGTGGAGPGAFHDVQVDHGGLMAAAAATLRARRCASVYLAPLGSTDA